MDSTQAKALAKSLEGSTVGGWLVDGWLGHGKSAVVLRATKAGVFGALKVFHPELIERYGETTQLARIERERSLIGVKHPNLVEIFDGGKCATTGHLFVVMENVPYENLKECLLSVPTTSIWTIMEQIASVGMFLEERGLVHRDIKPENIAISDDFTHVKVLDLGVLRPFGEANLTDVDQRPFIGTLRYSSPEFLQRTETDTIQGWRALTFYQIGAILHDLLMRKELFGDYTSPYSVLVRAVLDEVPEVFGTDARLVQLCNHCLTKNPQTRYELLSWADFKADTPEVDSLDKLRKRIATRQKYFHGLSLTDALAGGEFLRIQRHQLESLCNNLAATIGIVLNGLDCFPLRKITEDFSDDAQSCKLLVHFEKSEDLGLPAHLNVGFSISLLDENNGQPIYSVMSSAVLSMNELTFDDIDFSSKLTVGEGAEITTFPLIEGFLLQCLDATYQYTEVYGKTDLVHPVTLALDKE